MNAFVQLDGHVYEQFLTMLQCFMFRFDIFMRMFLYIELGRVFLCHWVSFLYFCSFSLGCYVWLTVPVQSVAWKDLLTELLMRQVMTHLNCNNVAVLLSLNCCGTSISANLLSKISDSN